jgi:hypothetical protein
MGGRKSGTGGNRGVEFGVGVRIESTIRPGVLEITVRVLVLVALFARPAFATTLITRRTTAVRFRFDLHSSCMAAIAISVLCWSACVGVDSAHAGRFGFGAGVGVSRTSFAGRPPTNSSYVAGSSPSALLRLDFEITPHVSLSLEPGWVQTRADLKFKKDVVREYQIQYIEVPLIVRVYTEANRKIRPYALAGLAIGVPLSAEAKSDTGTEDILDDLESIDARAKFGLGLRFPAGPGLLFCDVVFTQGLTNLTRNNTDPVTPSDPDRFKTSGLGLRLSWVVTP